MLALVKKPRIEISAHGERVDELIAWIRKKYEITILSPAAEESVRIEDTPFWREMERNRVGNLLAAARIKAGLTQAQLAEKIAVRQNMVSEYERGRRPLSASMAKRFSKALKIKMERLIPRTD